MSGPDLSDYTEASTMKSSVGGDGQGFFDYQDEKTSYTSGN